jgi:ribose 5-phosphate isomerase A
MDKLREAASKVARELSRTIEDGTVLGLGSGSTVAAVIEELSPHVSGKRILGVPTSTQIEMVAKKSGIELSPFSGEVDLVIDGADQVDRELNLIKGGGGALLREKVIMGSAGRVVIVAAEEKFSGRLCENGVPVPVEVVPMARESAKRMLSRLGSPRERLLTKGYPFFTENGNMILDTSLQPLTNPKEKELEIKSIPGVAEVGIFTFKPLTVCKMKKDGSIEKIGHDL